MADSTPFGAVPVAPVGASAQPPIALTGLVAVLQQNGRTLNSILEAIQALAGTLAPIYETGTWTPVLSFGGTTSGITYGTQLGSYTRTGREIVCRFKLVLTAVGSAAGSAVISGLPFQSNSDSTNTGAGGVLVGYSSMASIAGLPVMRVGPSSSEASLFTPGASQLAPLTNTNFTATTEIDGYLSYFN